MPVQLSGALVRSAIVAACVLGLASGAQAQAPAQPRAPMSITVGKITSEKQCTLYALNAGSSALYANPFALASVNTWRTWLVRDCVDNFTGLRTALQAALAASGKLPGKTSGGTYTVSGRISDVGADSSNSGVGGSYETATSGYTNGATGMFVSMDVTVTDKAGRIVYGALVNKRIDTSANTTVGGFGTSGGQNGQGLYSKLQREVALAVARQVAFHFAPLQVVSVRGSSIELNYGAPLLAAGSMVQVTSPDGSAVVRYLVSGAGQEGAFADREGDGDVTRIVPGSIAVVIEPEDPAANGRRFRRVELPG